MRNEMITKESFIPKFTDWIHASEPRMAADQIRVNMPVQIAREGTYAEFFAEAGEATVEIWDYGFSEFRVWLHRGNPQQEDVKTTHYEFPDFGEMYVALDNLFRQMTPVLGIGKRSIRRIPNLIR